MNVTFKRVALGIAFSPTAEAMLTETARVSKMLGAEVLLIHVGAKTADHERQMSELITKCGLPEKSVNIKWEKGDPASVILDCCRKEKVDLLVTGALKKENLVQYYVGSIARKILRKAPCSVLTMVHPSVDGTTFRNIVVNAEDSTFIPEAISTACKFAAKEPGVWVHIVRELKMYGLTMAASDQYTEDEYDDVRQKLVKSEIEKVEDLLTRIPHEGIRINIKMVSGKSGFELPRFAERKCAELLIVGAPPRKFSILDRIFPHDMEYILADLPCNLLVVKPTKN